MVSGGNPQTGVPEQPEHGQQQAARIPLAADHVDDADLVGVALPPTIRLAFAHEELKLRAGHQRAADLFQRSRDSPGDVAGGLRGLLAVRRVGVADAPGRVRLPRHGSQRGQIGLDQDVGETGLQAALDRDDVTLRRGVIDRPAERQPVLDRVGQLIDQHVPAPVDADQVGIRHPDHVHALGAQSLAGRRYLSLRAFVHSDSPAAFQGDRSGTNDLAA